MIPTHCPPARLAALTAIVDLATRIEWAADPNDALNMCAEFPGLIRALVEVLGDEGAKAGTVPDSLDAADESAILGEVMSGAVIAYCAKCVHLRYNRDLPSSCARLSGADLKHGDVRAWCVANRATDSSRPYVHPAPCPGLQPEETAEDLRALVERTAKATMAAVSGAIAVAEALETPESVAKRCRLVADFVSRDERCWVVESTGAVRVASARYWTQQGPGWLVFGEPLTYETELDALRAYAASVGK